MVSAMYKLSSGGIYLPESSRALWMFMYNSFFSVIRQILTGLARWMEGLYTRLLFGNNCNGDLSKALQ